MSVPDPASRRPLKSRASGWARGLAKLLIRSGLHANAISVWSTVFAAAGAASMLFASRSTDGVSALLWIGGALGIQLRLLCNLMDGMVAVEGGRRTGDGDLYNEFPDRISDVLILAAAGYTLPHDSWNIGLGWLAATGALVTAVVRLHGASLTGRHDFRGPMAKPHRMAVMTGACALMACGSFIVFPVQPMPWILGAVAAGTFLTAARRLVTLSTELRQ